MCSRHETMVRMPEQHRWDEIVDEEGLRMHVMVEPVSDYAARVCECMWMVESFDFDDVIELASAEDGQAFRFVRVIEQSPLVRTSAVLSEGAAASGELDALLGDVVEAGGYWERAFGGGLFVAVPPDSDLNVMERLDSL